MYFFIEMIVTILSYIIFTTPYQFEISFICMIIFMIAFIISLSKIKNIKNIYLLLFSILIILSASNMILFQHKLITEFIAIVTLFFIRDLLVAIKIERMRKNDKLRNK